MIVNSILECKKDRPLLVHERNVRPEGFEEEGCLEIDLVRLKMIISIIPLIMIMMKIITLMVIMVIQMIMTKYDNISAPRSTSIRPPFSSSHSLPGRQLEPARTPKTSQIASQT